MTNSAPLVLGPLMRFVDETSASIWVETRDAGLVDVHVGERSWRARTFAVHGHHYALVEVDGLEPGSTTAYSVQVDGTTVWPDAASDLPPSVIATLKPGKRLRLAFGSCRTSVSHDAEGNKVHGVDALRAYALRMTKDGSVRWPDLVLFLGDQVYADETTKEMQKFIESRRDIDAPPGPELQDYQEYAHLYRLAWSDPVNRWLLSTLPSAMMFDDHDIRDDWNTSLAWKQEIEQTTWWHGRIVSGLASYWVYQHLGNLSTAERAEDEIWQRVVGHPGDTEPDLSDELDAFADRADREPESYRWSYVRDLAEVRLVVLDSRAARVLEPANRSMLNEPSMRWLDEQMRGGFRHLLVGTGLPFLLPPGLHHIEAWDESVAGGAWGRRAARFAEKVRQAVDLEHWAAWQDGFQKVAAMAVEVADGRRGTAPSTVTFLSGDVHHSYVSEVRRERARAAGGGRIVQAVCSPIRNPLKRSMRFVTAFLSYGVAGVLGAPIARSAQVPDAPFDWGRTHGPWFDNSLATLEDRPDGLSLRWETGVVDGDDHLNPRVEEVAQVLIAADRPAPGNGAREWRPGMAPGGSP